MPLIDPAVGGSDVANKLSAQFLATPFNAAGLSVADVFAANGFSNFTTKDLAGTVGKPNNATAAGASAAPAPAAAAGNSSDPVDGDPQCAEE